MNLGEPLDSNEANNSIALNNAPTVLHPVLPARVIGEVFVLLYNYWREGALAWENGEEPPGTSLSDYVLVFWKALLSWELALLNGLESPTRPKRTYGAAKTEDILKLLAESRDGGAPYHSLLWIFCPLFAEVRKSFGQPLTDCLKNIRDLPPSLQPHFAKLISQ